MANIVTQLQNKDGDNLYPLAGGMAADSITTAMIQDGAVTSDKVDFTTSNTADKSYSPSSTVSVSSKSLDINNSTETTVTISNPNSALLVFTVFCAKGIGQAYYPRIVVDGTEYGLGEYNNSSNMYLSDIKLITGLSTGSHTISLGVIPNGTVTFPAYNSIKLRAIEIQPPLNS